MASTTTSEWELHDFTLTFLFPGWKKKSPLYIFLPFSGPFSGPEPPLSVTGSNQRGSGCFILKPRVFETERHRPKLSAAHQVSPLCRSGRSLWWNPPPHMSSQAGLWSSYTHKYMHLSAHAGSSCGATLRDLFLRLWAPFRGLTSSGSPAVCRCSCLHALWCTRNKRLHVRAPQRLIHQFGPTDVKKTLYMEL